MAEIGPIELTFRGDASGAIQAAEQAAQAVAGFAEAAAATDVPVAPSMEQQLQAIADRAREVGEAFQELGRTMSATITAPVMAAAAVGTDAWIEQEDAATRLGHVFGRVGANAWTTKEALEELAAELQTTTRFGDEAVMAAEAWLLRFRSIGPEIFERTLRASADLAAASGQDLVSVARTLGRALEAPEQGIARLGRSLGVVFTEAEQDAIKAMVEMGNLAAAQEAILAKVEASVGGMAAAMGANLGGAFARAKNAVSDFMERIGQALAPVLGAVAGLFERLARAALSIPQPLLNAAVAAATFAAAVGPLLLVTGWLITRLGALPLMISRFVAALTSLPSVMAGVISALANPVLLVVAGVFLAIAGAIAAATAALTFLWRTSEGFREAVRALWEVVKAVWTSIGEVIVTVARDVLAPVFDALRRAAEKFGQSLRDWLIRNRDGIIRFTSVAAGAFHSFLRVLAGVVWPIIRAVFGGFIRQLADAIQAVWHFAQAVARAMEAVVRLARGDLVGAWRAARQAIGAVGRSVRELGSLLTRPARTAADVAQAFVQAPQQLNEAIQAGTETALRIRARLEEIWPEGGLPGAEQAGEEAGQAAGEGFAAGAEEALEEARKIEPPVSRVPDIPEPRVVTPAVPAARLDQAASRLLDAAREQGQTAAELRRVLVSREGVAQIIGGMVRRESEESVLAALHTIEGAIWR